MLKKLLLTTVLMFSTLLMAFGTTFLSPSEAFKPSLKLSTETNISVNIELGEDIFLYVDKFALEAVSPDGVEVQNITFATPTKDHDGDMVYDGDLIADAVLTYSGDLVGVHSVELRLKFQGCAEAGLCYEPQKISYHLDVDLSKLTSKIEKKIEQEGKTDDIDLQKSDTDIIVDTLRDGSIWAVLLLFFGFGLALSLTPCIFPMIPILSSIIVSQGEGLSARRGFMLSLVYVLAMAFAYSLAGVAAGLFGENLQVALQNPYVIVSFAIVFIALAFSMFGFYEISMPSSFQTKLNRVSEDAGKKGGYVGVAIMGFLSALIVGPCVAPALAAALVYIGQSADALLGGAALFVLSLGMGAPLLLIGFGAGHFMPRPGGWMSVVTKVFGVVMIAIAIWMLSRILPDEITMVLWALFFIVCAIYMGALESLGDEKRSWNALLKSVAILSLMYGAILLVGALSGGSSLTKPLQGLVGSVTQDSSKRELSFVTIGSIDELDKILSSSKGSGVMLDFSAKWCAACKEYEEITFSDKMVIDALDGYTLIKADVTPNSDENKALMKKYGVFGPPVVIFFDKNSEVIEHKTLVGYTPPDKFLENLSR